MEKKQCLFCGSEVPQIPKKKPKLYCNPVCRQKDWQKKRREELERLRGTIPLPADYVKFTQIGVLKKDGTVETITDPKRVGKYNKAAIKGLKRAAKEINPLDYPRSQEQENDLNEAFSAAAKEMNVKISIEDVFMGHQIPKGLKGIELSIWKAEIKEKLK